MQDVDEYVPHYQYSARPAEMFSSICRSAGLQVMECTAQERSFSFQNINIVKSKSKLTSLLRDTCLIERLIVFNITFTHFFLNVETTQLFQF